MSRPNGRKKKSPTGAESAPVEKVPAEDTEGLPRVTEEA